ncbi:MAG: group II truncated hemoglobin, partial [Sulfuricella sp.]|nr:group II truncated hemoglobin [Sulfuricella sp.]
MQTHYERIGGEEVVRKLVDRFYDLMDQQQDLQGIRELHAKSLKASREKLFLFLSGWLGGPQLYVEKYGHPRLRQRHLPFAIGESERD